MKIMDTDSAASEKKPTAKSGRRRWMFWLRAGAGAALVAYLMRHTQWKPVEAAIQGLAWSHWVAALAVKTKATTAPSKALTFHPPCQRGREGRTYPGGAVVPLFISDLFFVIELYIAILLRN